MDKNIVIIFVCGLILLGVYLLMNEKPSNKPDDNLIGAEMFNSELNNKEFDLYRFYTKSQKVQNNNIITKDNFDFDYETDFKYNEHFSDDNVQTQTTPNLTILKKTSTYKETAPNNILDESVNWIDKKIDFLIPNNLDSNSVYSMPFPENTSIELASFTAENVTDLYDADNMENLYDTINADIYRGYKTLKFML